MSRHTVKQRMSNSTAVVSRNSSQKLFQKRNRVAQLTENELQCSSSERQEWMDRHIPPHTSDHPTKNPTLQVMLSVYWTIMDTVLNLLHFSQLERVQYSHIAMCNNDQSLPCYLSAPDTEMYLHGTDTNFSFVTRGWIYVTPPPVSSMGLLQEGSTHHLLQQFINT